MDSPPVDYESPRPANRRHGSLYSLRLILTVAALALWFLSLFLPVFKEAGSAAPHAILGYEMLLFVAYYSIVFVGLPWLFLNMALFFVAVINFAGVTGCLARAAGIATLVLTGLCTSALVAAHAVGFLKTEMLQIGIVPWTAAMVLAGGAAVLPSAATEVS